MTEESYYPGREIWKQHPTLPIEVSTLGKVRMGDEILPAINRKGTYYSRVTVPCVGRWNRHTLVAETWLGWVSGTDLCVLHRDEERPVEFVDAADNLWLGTRSENAKDRDQKGRLRGKKKNFIPEHIRQKCFCLRRLGFSYQSCGEILGISWRSVCNIVTRDQDLNNYVTGVEKDA